MVGCGYTYNNSKRVPRIFYYTERYLSLKDRYHGYEVAVDNKILVRYSGPMTTLSEDQAQSRYVQLLIDSGQKPKWATELFGKTYLWLVDPATDRWYLERLPDNA